MKIEQNKWTPADGWENLLGKQLKDAAQWVLIFGSKNQLCDKGLIGEIKNAYPNAYLSGCSTAGEILGSELTDDTVILTAVSFEKTTIKGYQTKMTGAADSFSAGQQLGKIVNKEGLRHIFVLAEGMNMYASDMIRGFSEQLSQDVKITGGLAGDGFDYKETFVVANAPAEANIVSIIAFYGDSLEVGYSSVGGWDVFGPERIVTRSQGNILYELDGKSALEIYKEYLGDKADDLPASGLYFPLSIKSKDGQSLIRTISSVSREDNSLTYVGDIPQGSCARLMRSNCEHLLEGAVTAAKNSIAMMPSKKAVLALLVDCIGRRLIFKQRAEEEFEDVAEVFGHDTAVTGFYSYGEIAPVNADTKCFLHNQTMTITTLCEG